MQAASVLGKVSGEPLNAAKMSKKVSKKGIKIIFSYRKVISNFSTSSKRKEFLIDISYQ